jgi:hypothetical protein
MIRRILPVLVVLGLLFAPSANAASKPSLGYYGCYQTTLSTSPITGATEYISTFTDSFTLLKHNHYSVSFIPRDPIPKYTYSKKKIHFKGGPFDDDALSWHIVADYHHAGVTMPNSALPDPAQKFTLVLRDTRSDDSDVAPPKTESAAASFYYCRKR